jgi:hypothetical protein
LRTAAWLRAQSLAQLAATLVKIVKAAEVIQWFLPVTGRDAISQLESSACGIRRFNQLLKRSLLFCVHVVGVVVDPLSHFRRIELGEGCVAPHLKFTPLQIHYQWKAVKPSVRAFIDRVRAGERVPIGIVLRIR